MEPEDSSGISERFAWFALGAMLGVTAAMLLAPDKGSSTRRRLAGHAKAHGQSLFDSSHEIIGRGRELFEKGREIAQEASELFERGRRMAEPAYGEQRSEADLEPTLDRGL
jgi:gas vesicle protein